MATSAPVPGPLCVRPAARDCVEELSSQLAAVNPSLDPDSFTAKAALLLLAAARLGQNIDRLSRLTGCERELVARCARRWHDSGVWAAGRTVSPWTEHGPHHPSLWKDVKVGVGVLWRTTDADGTIRWVAPGTHTGAREAAPAFRAVRPERYPRKRAEPAGGPHETPDAQANAGRSWTRPHRPVLFPDADWLT